MALFSRVLRIPALIMALVLLLPSAAHAHLRLVRSSPANGEHLSAAPASIRLVFSIRPELATCRVVLLAPNGDTVAVAPIVQSADGKTLDVPIRGALAGGRYRIVWRAASADGHAQRGEVSFDLAAASIDTSMAGMDHTMHSMPAAGAAGDTSHAARHEAEGHTAHHEISAVEATLRWLAFVGGFMLVGACFCRTLVIGRLRSSPSDETLSRAIGATARLGIVGALVYLVGHVGRLLTEGRRLAPDESMSSLMSTLAGTTWGAAWLVGLVGTMIAAVGLAVATPRRRGAWAIVALGGVLISAGLAACGHAADADSPALAISIMTVHYLTGAGWLGTLLVLLAAAIPAFVRQADDRAHGEVADLVATFSPVALACAALAGLTGGWTALLYLPIGALFRPGYGSMLLRKLVVLALVAALGFRNWRMLSPSLGTAESTRALRRSATIELALGAVVLLLSAILIAMPIE